MTMTINPDELARVRKARQEQGPPDLVLFVSANATALYVAIQVLIGADYEATASAKRITEYLSKINDAVREDGRIVPRIKGACPEGLWTNDTAASAFVELIRAGMARRGSDTQAMLIKLIPPTQHGKRALKIDPDAPAMIQIAP